MAPTPAPPRTAVVGFGALGEALVRGLRAAGHPAPTVVRRPQGPAARAEEPVRAAGGTPAASLADGLAEADVVLVCVPGSVCLEVAEQAQQALAPGALYVDLASAAPEDKQRAGEVVAAAGARYVDAAVLGAVAASGAALPVLAAGPGAVAFAQIAAGMGLMISTLDGPAGAAARVKLLRSVYMKGRDALVAEMLEAARHHGLERVVSESIRGPGEEVPFPQLAERVLASLSVHAERRADELQASAALLRACGVEPVVTEGAEQRLRRVARSAPPGA